MNGNGVELPPNRLFVVSLILLFGLATALVLAPFVSYVLLGLLAAYLLYPAYGWLCRRTKRPHLAATVMLLLLLAVIVVPFALMVYEMATDIAAVAEGATSQTVGEAVDSMVNRLAGLVGLDPPAAGTSESVLLTSIPKVQAWLSDQVPRILSFVGNLFIGLFILSFVFFYGLVDGSSFIGYVRSLIPLSPAQTNELFHEIKKTVEAVFYGQMAAAIVQGSLGGLGFIIFGVPSPFFWGFVMIVLSIIPFLGSFLIWGPAALYLLAQGHTWAALGLFLWGAILVSNIDNVLKPYLIGRRAQIHPVVALVGVLGGIVAFGFIGFLVGPLVISIFVALLNFWREDYLPHYQWG